MSNIDAIKANSYQDDVDNNGVRKKIDNEFKDLVLSDLRVVATIGVGGFGRVSATSLFNFFCLIRILQEKIKRRRNTASHDRLPPSETTTDVCSFAQVTARCQ